ncbi:MAG TPA: ammonium transporter [Blastocatellia bacterium]|nr:ammonium transporter [Blastocatellia bacterium]
MRVRRTTWLLAGLVLPAVFPFAAYAQDAAVEDRLKKLEDAAAAAQGAADNGWMLVCCALVLLMTGPGLALFYGGLVNRKNVLATVMQSFVLMALVTVLWFGFGYSMAFGSGDAVVGGLSHVFLRGVGLEPNADYAPTIPHQTFMMFQLMFAIITPALITGAFAERMKFSAMLAFTVLWTIVVYNPLAHMVWGKGGLFNAALGGRFPALDFAGGTVVHISSGVSALVCAIYIGKRAGYPSIQSPPHNLVLSFIGACLLWVGWFGFNAGSAVSSGGLATSAFVATHFAAASGALGWIAAEWARTSKPSLLGAISGAVAGLVAVTPASGFVSPASALLIGLMGGALCHLMTTAAKRRFGYDDSLDVFGVHGAAGTLGALLTGVFATFTINPIFKDAGGQPLPVGAIDGNLHQVVNQAIAIGASWLIAAAGTLAVLKLVDVTIGLRVSDNEEAIGLDLTQHGEEAYAYEDAAGFAVIKGLAPHIPAPTGNVIGPMPEPALSEAGD